VREKGEAIAHRKEVTIELREYVLCGKTNVLVDMSSKVFSLIL
jgi:hypothetical protein